MSEKSWFDSLSEILNKPLPGTEDQTKTPTDKPVVFNDEDDDDSGDETLDDLLDDILNRVPRKAAPYVGASAFAHKAGLHASAIVKNPATYEHIEPETVGNARIIPMSNQAGQSNLRARLAAERVADGLASRARDA